MSAVAGTRYAVNLSLVFSDLPLEERPRAAAAAGFSAVELWWPFAGPTPSDAEASRLVAAITEAGVLLAGLNFDAGDMAAGDRGLVSLPDQSARFRESVTAAVELAERVGGCDVFNALYGNRIDGITAEEQDETALENLAFASRRVRPLGAKVVLEALNSFESPRYPIVSTVQALATIDRVASSTGETIGYLYDCYHMQRMEGNLIATIRRHGERFGHVQIADSPDRTEPGTGEICYRRVLEALAASGYEGWVALEYRPSGNGGRFEWLDELKVSP